MAQTHAKLSGAESRAGVFISRGEVLRRRCRGAGERWGVRDVPHTENSTEAHQSLALARLTGDAQRIAGAFELEKAGRRAAEFAKLDYVFVGSAFPSQFY